MAGVTQPPARITATELEVPTEDEAIAMALEMCPDGGFIELHSSACDLPETCVCVPRVLYKGARA